MEGLATIFPSGDRGRDLGHAIRAGACVQDDEIGACADLKALPLPAEKLGRQNS